MSRKPWGYYKKLSDEELISEAKLMKAKSPKYLAKKASRLSQEIYDRDLMTAVFPLEKRSRKPRNYYLKMNDEDLIEEAKKYCASSLTDLRNQAAQLVNRLCERKSSEGVRLIDIVFPFEERVQKQHGYYSNMSNKELILEAEKYDADSPKSLDRVAHRLYTLLNNRKEKGRSLINLIFPIEKRKRKPNGYYKKMSKKQLVSEARQYEAKSVSELQNQASQLTKELYDRELMEEIFPLESRCERPKGYYKRMSDKVVLAEVQKKGASSPSNLLKKEYGLYRELNLRVTKKGIKLMEIAFPLKDRLRKPTGHYSKMTDDELLKEGKKYAAQSPSGLAKKNGSLFNHLISRRMSGVRLIDIIFPIEKRIRKPSGYYSNMNDEQLITEAKKYSMKSPVELEEKAGSLYNHLCNRGLINSIFPLDQRKRRPQGYYSKMSDEELIVEGRKYNAKTPRDLKEKASRLYELLHDKKLLNQVLLNNDSIDSILESYVNGSED